MENYNQNTARVFFKDGKQSHISIHTSVCTSIKCNIRSVIHLSKDLILCNSCANPHSYVKITSSKSWRKLKIKKKSASYALHFYIPDLRVISACFLSHLSISLKLISCLPFSGFFVTLNKFCGNISHWKGHFTQMFFISIGENSQGALLWQAALPMS